MNAVIDFSVVHPAAVSYCKDASRAPRSVTANRATQKNTRYRQQYLNHDNSNFIPFIVENGGIFGRDAEEAFSKICNIIALQTGQNRSSIAYFLGFWSYLQDSPMKTLSRGPVHTIIGKGVIYQTPRTTVDYATK